MHRQEYSISRIATLTYSRVRELPLSVTVHQGHAHALNLKESGVDVVVGLYEVLRAGQRLSSRVLQL